MWQFTFTFGGPVFHIVAQLRYNRGSSEAETSNRSCSVYPYCLAKAPSFTESLPRGKSLGIFTMTTLKAPCLPHITNEKAEV